MATAQEAFRELLRDGLRPRLEGMGFAGAGATFTWPSATCFAQLGLQRSQYNDRAELRFTINVTVADREAWEQARSTRPELPLKPAPNTFYGNYIWQRRIGRLLPGGEDKWWSVAAGADWGPIAQEVEAAVREFVLPELRSRAVSARNCRAALLDLGVRIGQHALVDMADPAGRWSELTALEAGQHEHLDRLMSKPPAPGSSDWIPVVEQVAAFLRRGPGHWMVSLLIGEADRVPATPTSPEVARSWVARPEEFEPPAVYRLIGPAPRAVDDDDYFRAWDELRPDGINEIVSFSRSASAREAGEGWAVRIGLRIDG